MDWGGVNWRRTRLFEGIIVPSRHFAAVSDINSSNDIQLLRCAALCCLSSGAVTPSTTTCNFSKKTSNLSEGLPGLSSRKSATETVSPIEISFILACISGLDAAEETSASSLYIKSKTPGCIFSSPERQSELL